jgi:hypothetical protein
MSPRAIPEAPKKQSVRTTTSLCYTSSGGTKITSSSFSSFQDFAWLLFHPVRLPDCAPFTDMFAYSLPGCLPQPIYFGESQGSQLPLSGKPEKWRLVRTHDGSVLVRTASTTLLMVFRCFFINKTLFSWHSKRSLKKDYDPCSGGTT